MSEKHLVRINLRNRKSEYKNIIYPIAEIEKYFEEESAKYDIYYETSFYRDLKKFFEGNQMNKVLVTGADGFIGSHLVEELIKKVARYIE